MSGFDDYAYSIAKLLAEMVQEVHKQREIFITKSYGIVTTWHRPRPIMLHGIHTKPLSKPLTEEDSEEELLLLRALIDTASFEASRGFEPPRREKKTHTHTRAQLHTGKRVSLHPRLPSFIYPI